MSEPVLDKPLAPGVNCKDAHIPARGREFCRPEPGASPPGSITRPEKSPFTGQWLNVTYHGLAWHPLLEGEWGADLDLPVLATWEKTNG